MTNNNLFLPQLRIVSSTMRAVFACMDLLVWICVWFYFRSQSQGEILNCPFPNALSKNSAVRFITTCIKFITTMLLLRDKAVVESSQLILSQTSTCK